MLSGKYKKISMFPFWMFRIAEPTLFEKRWAGLGLKSDTIFVPAFKMSNLRRMAMLTLYFSRKKQKINFDIIDQTCYNCFPSEVSRMEAERMIIPLLLAGGEDLNRINLDDFWCQAQFCREAVAVWLPFADDGLSYVAPFVDCGFEKAVLMR